MTRERCINRELTIEVIVGAFMMTVLLGLGYFTIILSHESLFQKTETMEILFTHVMGLREGDAVVCRGMPVGKVQTLDMQSEGVHVLAEIERPLSLREDYAIEIVNTSMLGGRHMEIHLGSADARLLGPVDLYMGEPPKNIMSDAADVVAVLRRTLIDEGAMANLQRTTTELRNIVERVARGEGTVGKLLSADATLFDDMHSAVASVGDVAERLQNGQGTIGKLLSEDTRIYDDLAATSASLREIAEKLEKGESSLGRLMADDAGMYEDLSAAIASLREVATRLEQGQGLIGKLTTDDELYDDIKGTVGELRGAIEDMRESSPVTTFSSIFFGAL